MDLREKFEEDLNHSRSKLGEAILGGVCKDMEHYNLVVGTLNGIEIAREKFLELWKQQQQ